MEQKETTIKTPGKLMIAGEFAVLEPNQKLIVTAVNRFVYTTIHESNTNKVTLSDFNIVDLHWSWKKKNIHFSMNDDRLHFVRSAMEIAFYYLKENKAVLHPVQLTLKSELADKSGTKYGLGSSAAVVTSVVQAILTHFLPDSPQKEVIFKLAAIAHINIQGNGSGADIAASTYSGILEYTSFQAEWLIDQLRTNPTLCEMVEKNWIYLSIQRLTLPPSVKMLVAWTKKAASTKNLVGKIKSLKDTKSDSYEQFLQDSKRAVAAIIQGVKHDDLDALFSGINSNRIALSQLGKTFNVPIETDQLYILSAVAHEVGGAGKLSGAGGGDCGIAFIPHHISDSLVKQKWQEKGIQPLDLKLYDDAQE